MPASTAAREPVKNIRSGDEIVFPVRSPDGKLIIYKSNSHLWAMNADGSNKRQLTFGPFEDSRPAMAPGGRTVAAVAPRLAPFGFLL